MNLPEPHSKSFDALKSDIESGRLKLPQFQREFIWELEKSRGLMDSIVKGYPIGTFIFWLTHDRLRYLKEIGDLKLPDPPKGDLVNFVLDGQQRITTIYACIKGAKVKRENKIIDYSEMYVDLDVNLDSTLDDQIIITDISEKDDYSYISIIDLMNGGITFFNKFPVEYHQKLELYKKNIESYRFSVIDVRDISLDVATEIFTRINIGGKPLSLFEIMVAKTFDEERDFDLARKAEEFIEELRGIGYETVSDSVILQTISLILINSCARRDILKLNKEKFIDIWDKAIDSIRAAIDYFKKNYRIIVSKLLPYNALIVPFAYFFYNHNEPPVGKQSDYLKDFFWRCAISERYTAGQESKLAQDIDRINDILDGKQPKYNWTVNFSPEYIKDFGYFSTGRSFIKAILCLYAYFQPKSFDTNADVIIDNSWLKQANSKNYHHFFPRAYLKKRRVDENKANHILNITIVDDYLNKRKIKAQAPSKYMKDFEKKNPKLEDTMKTHLINDLEKFGIWDDNYDAFFDERAKLVSNELGKRILEQEGFKERKRVESWEKPLPEGVDEKYNTTKDFVFNEIRRIIGQHSERTSGEVIDYCNDILIDKMKLICFNLDNILNKEGLKKVTFDMLEKIKSSDDLVKNFDLIKPKEKLIFNYSRIWHIIREMLNGAWVSEDAINYLRNYLEKWLEIHVLNAIEKMKRKDPWRKTLKVRDFEY
ncbi:MAG: GmrSD restriction endonuclease domain-containing protein [Candidatus Helarchaeota archaeon]